MSQDVPASPSISTDYVVLEVTDHFIYLCSIFANNLSLDLEIEKRIVKAAALIAKLNKRVWEKSQLTLRTQLIILLMCTLF